MTMKTIFLTMSVAAMLAQAVPAHTANPLGFRWQEKGLTENGIAYENFLVRCSDNTLRPITHYENGEGWCITDVSCQYALRR